MKPSTAAIGAVCILFIALSSSIALAWTPDWGPVANRNTGYYYAGYAGNGFQTSSMRGSWDVAPMRSQAQSQVALGTMNRYGSGNYGNSIRSAGWNGNRADRTGPYLTAPGDTALAFPVARYQDPVYRGAYSGYTGQHYNAFTGRVQNQDPYQSTGIRARSYPDPRYVTPEWR